MELFECSTSDKNIEKLNSSVSSPHKSMTFLKSLQQFSELVQMAFSEIQKGGLLCNIGVAGLQGCRQLRTFTSDVWRVARGSQEHIFGSIMHGV